MKVPIDTLPVELRIKIYELGADLSSISVNTYVYDFPWSRTILLSGILNDKDAIEIAAIQQGKARIRRMTCELIAVSGNLPMMKWARSDRSSTKDDAADDRSIKQIRPTPFPWDKETCRNAAKFGHLKLLQWLHKQGCPWNDETFSSAAHSGNMKMMEWLYERKCPWDKWTYRSAAESGSLDVLKWLYEKKCPLSRDTMSSAARFGNIEMLELGWLRQMKYDWGKSTFYGAARSGNLDVLKWLRERHCPWNYETFSAAVGTGNFELVE
jgi:hypothetical protein